MPTSPARKPAARKPAAKRTSPATAAAAKQEAQAKAEARVVAEAELEAAKAAMIEQFKNLQLPEPEYDADGYEIIPSKADEPGGTYKFTAGGHRFELPNLQYLPLSLAKVLETAESDADAFQAIIDRYAPDLMEHVDASQIMHISKRWQDHSKGLTLGE